MGLISYSLGIPATNNDPSLDQPLMLINTDNIAAALAVDHIPFNTNNTGYHTIIHQFPNGGGVPVDPATIAGVNQVYAKNVTITDSIGSITDTQLFSRTGLGDISQMTGFRVVNSNSSNGYQFLGGVILQWGVIAPGAGPDHTVLFNTSPNFDFPTNLFNVQVTVQNNVATQPPYNFYVDNTTLSRQGFTIKTQGDIYGFFWLAIGN